MPVSDKEHFDALLLAAELRRKEVRDADQRAIELLAKANAARVSTGLLVASVLIALLSVLVAVAALVLHSTSGGH